MLTYFNKIYGLVTINMDFILITIKMNANTVKILYDKHDNETSRRRLESLSEICPTNFVSFMFLTMIIISSFLRKTRVNLLVNIP